MTLRRWAPLALATLLAFFANEPLARAQACCVGASGLTPGWLANHEKALVGAQLRLSSTHGTYPARGEFYAPPPGRDARVESTIFGSVRFLPRAQVSLSVPFTVVRRRAGATVEGRAAFGDVALIGRYDLVRAGESRIPGIALLAGAQAPSGVPSDRATGLLAADATGIGAWEASAGASVEQTYGGLVLHATVLAGLRTPRDVLGVSQTLGPRALYVLAGGWVWDADIALLGTVSHSSEGDTSIAGEDVPGTGFRSTQVALLVVATLADAWRLRTSVFTDVPPLGENRPALGGSTISLARTWL